MKQYDLIVIGAGPGGYVSAIYAARHGLKTAILDRHASLGGTCLNVGCIPTKTLIESANLLRKARGAKEFGVVIPEVDLDYATVMKRKDRVVNKLTKGVAMLMKANGIDVVTGTASFTDPHTLSVNGESYGFRHCIIATGSASADLPHIQADGQYVLNSTHALALETLPTSMVIIGGGVIGVEFAAIYATFGVKVTVLEWMDQLLPGMDPDVAGELQRAFRKQKIKVVTGAKVTGAADGVVTWDTNGEVASLEADRVLLAVGRVPVTDGLDLAAAGLDTDDRGHIPVGTGQQTAVPHIYAIGDVIDTPKLAHLASREGIQAVHHMLGTPDDEDLAAACPGVVYSYPEIAAVGMTAAQAADRGITALETTFPLTANSKASVEGVKAGLVKVVHEADTGRVLGIHMIGGKASEMIGEATLAVRNRLTVQEMGRMIHPHPTMSESLLEAFHMASGTPIHT